MVSKAVLVNMKELQQGAHKSNHKEVLQDY